MLHFAVSHAETVNEQVRLELPGLAVDGHDYHPDQLVEIAATTEDVKFTPPDQEIPLIGRDAKWNGRQFKVVGAYLKDGPNFVIVLGE